MDAKTMYWHLGGWRQLANPLSLCFPSCTKLQCMYAPAEGADTPQAHLPYFICTLYVLCAENSHDYAQNLNEIVRS
jgi:hypothetical protein